MDQQNRSQSDLWQQKKIHGSICGYPLQKMTSCGDTTVPTGQRLVFPMRALKGNTRSRYENGDNEESVGGRYIGAKFASCLWIFSKAVKNNWCEERRRRPIQDMNRICNRVEEEHVSISEFHLLYRNTDIGQVTVRHGSTLRLAMVLPLFRGTDKTR